MVTGMSFKFVTDKMTQQILFNSFGQKGTLVVWAFIIIVQYVAMQN